MFEGTGSVFNTCQFPQTFLTNPSKLRIYLYAKRITLVYCTWRLCFERFGDRVKYWITLNEPWEVAIPGYCRGQTAPGHKDLARGAYIAVKNLILSHAKAWHTYDKEFRPKQHGQISITLDSSWPEPYTSSKQDQEAAERFLAFHLDLFAHPIFVDGDFSPTVKEQVSLHSKASGIESRLPGISANERKLIKGSHDFFGLNFYRCQLVKHKSSLNGAKTPQTFDTDRDTEEMMDSSWPGTDASWLRMTSFGIRRILKYIKDHYGNPRIIITENGCTQAGEHDAVEERALEDYFRVDWYRRYLNEVGFHTLYYSHGALWSQSVS